MDATDIQINRALLLFGTMKEVVAGPRTVPIHSEVFRTVVYRHQKKGNVFATQFFSIKDVHGRAGPGFRDVLETAKQLLIVWNFGPRSKWFRFPREDVFLGNLATHKGYADAKALARAYLQEVLSNLHPSKAPPAPRPLLT